MASLKQHSADCKAILGKDWFVVHQWLDEYAKIYWPAKMHRVHRHHKDGVADCVKKWGEQAGHAAMIHILTDEGEILSEEGIHKKYGIDYKKIKDNFYSV